MIGRRTRIRGGPQWNWLAVKRVLVLLSFAKIRGSSMPEPGEGGMLFSFVEMEREIENMARLADPFLEAGCVQQIIRPWLVQLQNLSVSQPGTSIAWKI